MFFAHFGHSHARRLHERCRIDGIYGRQLFRRPDDVITIEGYSGLTYHKILSRPRWYLRHLRHRHLDGLCIDLGSNDLSHQAIEPSDLIGLIDRFLHVLNDLGIDPKVIMFLTVVNKTYMSHHPNQVSLQEYNQKVATFNQLLRNVVRPHHPYIQVWSQEPVNGPQFPLQRKGCEVPGRKPTSNVR